MLKHSFSDIFRISQKLVNKKVSNAVKQICLIEANLIWIRLLIEYPTHALGAGVELFRESRYFKRKFSSKQRTLCWRHRRHQHTKWIQIPYEIFWSEKLLRAVKRYLRLTQDKPEIIRKVMHNLHTSQFGEQQLRRLRDVYENCRAGSDS